MYGVSTQVERSGDEVPNPQRPKEPPKIGVERGELLMTATLDSSREQVVKAPDGLEIRIPAGALKGRKSIRIHRATVSPPGQSLGTLDGQPPTPARVASAWDIDVGEERGFFSKTIEISLPSPKAGEVRIPMISADGRRWRSVDFEVRDGRTYVKTRHFSPLIEISLAFNPAWLIGIPIAALVYVWAKGENELPSVYNEHAPFVRPVLWDTGPFELLWSKKLPGVDPATGFVDPGGFRSRLLELTKDPRCRSHGLETPPECKPLIQEAIEKYLVPKAVLDVKDALAFARSYLDTRNFAQPSLDLPVYVVPSAGNLDGALFNPWSGRRYMIVGATQGTTRADLYRTALHELFHSYQSAYVWMDFDSYTPLCEASAVLLEREARDHYLANAQVELRELETPARFDTYSRGLDFNPFSDETESQRHGYGLSWFLEYCKEKRYSGVKTEFHPNLLSSWSGYNYAEQHRALKWAAGGSDSALAEAFKGFAKDEVLTGMTGATRYGKTYFPANPGELFKSPFKSLDLSSSSFVDVGDNLVTPWSIQFFRIEKPSRPNAGLVVRVPRAWGEWGWGREAYFGANAESSATIRTLSEAEAAPAAKEAYRYVSLPGADDRYFFVVDTGQAKSGYIRTLEAARVALLEPPISVQTETDGDEVVVKWAPPPSAGNGLITHYLLYQSGKPKRVASVLASSTKKTVPLKELGGTAAVEMTSAVYAGDDGTANEIYIESARSSGAPAAGGIRVVNGPLPPGWVEDTSSKRGTWATHPSIRFRTELALGLTRADKGATGGAQVDSGILRVNSSVDELKSQCDGKVPKTRYDCFNCPVHPGSTRTTISGFPAWRSEWSSSESNSDSFPKDSPRGVGGRLHQRNVTWLVEVAPKTYVVILAGAGSLEVAIPGFGGAEQLRSYAADCDTIVGGLRIETK